MIYQEIDGKIKLHVTIPEGFEAAFKLLQEMDSDPCNGINYSDDDKKNYAALKRALKRVCDVAQDETLHWSHLSSALEDLRDALKELGVVLLLEEQE